MCGKLFVQEWLDHKKAVAFGTLTAALVLVVLLFLLHLLNIGFVSAMASFAAVGGAGAAIVATCIFLALGYWKTTRGSRAYFTFSIPATGRQIFWAKVLFAYLMVVAAIVIFLGAVLLTMWNNARTRGVSLTESLAPIRTFLVVLGTWKVATGVVLILLFLFLYVAVVAALISITAQEQYQRHAGAFVFALFLVYIAVQTLSLLATFFLPGTINLATGELSWETMFPAVLETIRTGADPVVLGLGSIPVSIVFLSGVIWWGVRAVERPSVR
ncbi:hypothetical protein [Trueperella pyogenes]|uniref:hypothetical protein n=1 Tax=Trueperella pyogenes TaxID=1661 RepID=UPI00345C6F56